MKKRENFVHILFVSFNKNSGIRLGNLINKCNGKIFDFVK